MSTTKSVGDLLRDRTPTTEQLKPIGSNKVRTTGTTETIDAALEATKDLISEQFKPWYAKQAYRLGVHRYLGLASDARQGRSPARLFSHLLRRAS